MKSNATVAFFFCAMLLSLLPASAQEKTILNFYVTSYPTANIPSHDLKSILINNFMHDNPDIEIKMIPVGSAGDYLKNIHKSFSENREPDLFATWADKVSRDLAQNGKLLDLSEESGRLVFCQPAKDSMSFQGRLYAIAPLWQIAGLYINATRLKELSISAPHTLEELERTAELFLAHGIQPFAVGSADKWPLTHLYSYLVERYAFDQAGKAMLERSMRFDADPFVKAALKIQEWGKRGYFGTQPLAENYQTAIDLMWAGKASMQLTGTWLTGALLDKQKTNQSYLIIPFPVLPGNERKRPLVLGMPHIAFAASRNAHQKKDAIIRFFMYALGESVFKELTYVVSSVPGAITDYPLVVMGNNILQEAGLIAFWWDQMIPGELVNSFYDTVYSFLMPETDVRAALTKMEDLLTQKLGPVKEKTTIR